MTRISNLIGAAAMAGAMMLGVPAMAQTPPDPAMAAPADGAMMAPKPMMHHRMHHKMMMHHHGKMMHHKKMMMHHKMMMKKPM